jgi:hypothetical protein
MNESLHVNYGMVLSGRIGIAILVVEFGNTVATVLYPHFLEVEDN